MSKRISLTIVFICTSLSSSGMAGHEHYHEIQPEKESPIVQPIPKPEIHITAKTPYSYIAVERTNIPLIHHLQEQSLGYVKHEPENADSNTGTDVKITQVDVIKPINQNHHLDGVYRITKLTKESIGLDQH